MAILNNENCITSYTKLDDNNVINGNKQGHQKFSIFFLIFNYYLMFNKFK